MIFRTAVQPQPPTYQYVQHKMIIFQLICYFGYFVDSFGDFSDGDPSKLRKFPINTVEHFMSRFGHKYIDVLKIDIEGAEYSLLEVSP